MTKARQKMLEAADEIADWKAGKTKASVYIDGRHYRVTIDEYLAFRAKGMSVLEMLEAGDFDDVPDDGDVCAGKRADS